MRHFSPTLGFALLVHVAASATAAAAPDTWVAGTGVDTGNCPATAPCRSLQYALGRTRKGGVIAVKSSGSFAGVRIDKSVTIAADGVVAIIRTAVKCGAAVCVDAGNGIVALRGLTIDPLGRGINGIEIRQVGLFHLKQSVVRQSKTGLVTRSPGTTYWGKISVWDSVFSSNDVGIRVVANADVKVALDRLRVHNNNNGIVFDDSARNGTIKATVTDSVIAGQAGRGIYAVTGGPGPSNHFPNVSVTVDRSAVLDNRHGIMVSGEAARVRIANSTITGNNIALRSVKNGAIPSYGTNKIDGNGAGETPTLLIPTQ